MHTWCSAMLYGGEFAAQVLGVPFSYSGNDKPQQLPGKETTCETPGHMTGGGGRAPMLKRENSISRTILVEIMGGHK